jgi:hypothetical protein
LLCEVLQSRGELASWELDMIGIRAQEAQNLGEGRVISRLHDFQHQDG